MRYLVTITETYQKTYLIEADYASDAKQYVDNLYSAGEIEMGINDWVDSYLEAIDAEPGDEEYYEVIKV